MISYGGVVIVFLVTRSRRVVHLDLTSRYRGALWPCLLAAADSGLGAHHNDSSGDAIHLVCAHDIQEGRTVRLPQVHEATTSERPQVRRDLVARPADGRVFGSQRCVSPRRSRVFVVITMSPRSRAAALSHVGSGGGGELPGFAGLCPAGACLRAGLALIAH